MARAKGSVANALTAMAVELSIGMEKNNKI
jgi:hypothetical protein